MLREVKVLVVEDDPALGASLLRVMADEAHEIDLCTTGREGAARALSGRYDIILLDWMLPDLDGLSVCRSLRGAGYQLPILMLTARSEIADRVLGLRSGADDYLCKPFEVDELLARMDALVRRRTPRVVRLRELEIDLASRRIALGGTQVDLTTREFDLLACLVSNGGNPVSRATLLSAVWGTKVDPGTTVVEVYVSRLREKLGPEADVIETVRGVGYRLRMDLAR